MALLKKITSSTLVEVLISSVILILIFFISSMILIRVSKSIFYDETEAIETTITALHYMLIHQKIQLPYQQTHDLWEIRIEGEDKLFYLEAKHSETHKTIQRNISTFD